MTPQPALKTFECLDEARMRDMAPNGAVRSYPKNAVVITEGDLTDSLYVVLAGRVKIFMSDEDGKEIVLNVVREGDYFGEIVLDGGPRSASVATLEPCRLFVVPHGDARTLVERNPAFAHDLILRLIGRVRSLADTVRSLALKDVYGRLAAFIEGQAVEHEGLRIVCDPLTQGEIATRIGASREMVSRIFRDLAAGGYISIKGKRIAVLKKLPEHW